MDSNPGKGALARGRCRGAVAILRRVPVRSFRMNDASSLTEQGPHIPWLTVSLPVANTCLHHAHTTVIVVSSTTPATLDVRWGQSVRQSVNTLKLPRSSS